MIKVRITNGQGELMAEMPLGTGTHLIGRMPENAICLKDMKVSRTHAEFEVTPDKCILRDKGSSTGTYVNEERIEEEEIRDGDIINIGDMVIEIKLVEEIKGTPFSENQEGCFIALAPDNAIDIVIDRELVLGRMPVPENDVQVLDKMASRRHAKLFVQGNTCFIEDLKSANGTFVNGELIIKQPLREGDVLTIGNFKYRFIVREKQTAPAPATPPPTPSPDTSSPVASSTTPEPEKSSSESSKPMLPILIFFVFIIVIVTGISLFSQKKDTSKKPKKSIDNSQSEKSEKKTTTSQKATSSKSNTEETQDFFDENESKKNEKLLAEIRKVKSRKLDQSKVVTAQACMMCHRQEVGAWRNTHHFKTFYELEKKPHAKEIAQKMGIKNIKKEGKCNKCHYTLKKSEGKFRPISGIACEACHGAARDWIRVHNDLSLSKEERIKKSEAAGMIRPANIYYVAQNCYQCHTVPSEELVIKGGHVAGSKFDLVAWSQGEIRHNFRSGQGKNKPASNARKRVMFVLGTLLDLEYSLRGVAKATKKSKYSKSMGQRYAAAKRQLQTIHLRAPIPEIAEFFEYVKKSKGAKTTKTNLLKRADRVALAAIKFAKHSDGTQLGALDQLIPDESKYRGKAQN